MREWCGDWEDEKKVYARVRGGSWGNADITNFRTATRNWNERTNVNTNNGFRAARAPRLDLKRPPRASPSGKRGRGKAEAKPTARS
jgi:hypothetical protein